MRLDADSRRYLARAREGLDRQTAIVRAMSEASRLEAATKQFGVSILMSEAFVNELSEPVASLCR